MRMKKMLPLLFVFGLLFIGCDLVYENEINETETSAGKESSGGGTTKTLSENKWATGEFSKDGQIDTYYISVTKDMRYFIYMNNAYSGDGKKTAYTGLKISHNDGTIICDSYDSAKNLYTTPYKFTASSTGTVTITMASRGSYYEDWEKGTGTYAIKYTSQPEYYDYELSEGDWEEGEIKADGQKNRYSIKATAGMRYFIYMNNAYGGDKTKTAYTGLKISHSDGTEICSNYNSAYNLYSTPYMFTASSTGTITITVASRNSYYGYWEQGTGTYTIKCISRKECYELSEDDWKDDEIITDGQTNSYSIDVIFGTQYSIRLNDAYEGDDSKTAKMGLKIMYSQDSDGINPIICNSYDNAKKLYSKPYTFTASKTGTVVITAASYYNYSWEKGSGTYAIKYTSYQPVCNPISGENEWKDGEITAVGQTNNYSINVNSGKRYFIYINDAYEGDRTKTAQVGLKILHSDGTTICSSYGNASKLYSNPYTFIATSTGTVMITAACYSSSWEQGTGTYAIKYTSRTVEDYALTKDVWKDDDIIADGQTNSYSINVIKGRQYFICMNNKYGGDGEKTAYTGLKIYHSDGTTICDNYSRTENLYLTPYTFTASSTGTVMITAACYNYSWEKGTGTYAIKYTEGN